MTLAPKDVVGVWMDGAEYLQFKTLNDQVDEGVLIPVKNQCQCGSFCRFRRRVPRVVPVAQMVDLQTMLEDVLAGYHHFLGGARASRVR